MYNDFSERLARLIVNYAVNVELGDLVLIQAPTNAEELVREIYREVIQAGGHILLNNLAFDGQKELFYQYASEEQLKYLDPLHTDILKKINKFINISSSYNTRALSSIPPEKKAMVAEAKKEQMKIFFERMSKGELKWNLSPYPCAAFAQEANMGRLEYLEFVYKALHLQDDPVLFWTGVEADQEMIVEVLNKGSEIQIIGKDTDLSLGIDGRKWINCCGHLNLPDGEVFTGPIENSVNGTIRFTYPGIYQDQEIKDIKLTFKEGKVIDFDAVKGEELLGQLLTTKNADILGEVAIGTNYGIQRFTKNMLFDEKMGGSVHLALGSGIPETGSTNHSAIHWDILKDMKTPESKILLDGEIIYKGGQWLIP